MSLLTKRCRFVRWSFTIAFVSLVIESVSSSSAFSKIQAEERSFRSGVARVDISPVKLPVISSGSFLTRSGNVIHDRLFARGLALDDGATRLVFVVADTLFVPRDLCDEVKEAASKKTGIPTENMMISATHSHSAGSLVGCLGTDADSDYVNQVRPQLIDCIQQAVANLQRKSGGLRRSMPRIRIAACSSVDRTASVSTHLAKRPFA